MSKSLAGATARATVEVADRIKQVQTESLAAAGAMDDIVAAIQAIHGVSAAIAAAVEQQEAATHEIARNIQRASGSSGEVSHHVKILHDIAAQTGQSSKELLVSSHIMAGLSNDLDEKVQQFSAFVQTR